MAIFHCYVTSPEGIDALVFERYTASKERWEYMDHHFKMLFAVLRCEPDTNQMKRN